MSILTQKGGCGAHAAQPDVQCRFIFGHSFGHGVGLDIHEHPIAAPGVHAKLPEHTVISAEPGIYLPGKFGVRIEDVMHLTADGAEILTRSPKNLIIL